MGVRAFRVRVYGIQFIQCYVIEHDTFKLCNMSINLVRTILRAFSLILRLLSASLSAVKKVLDIIDDGIENGSSVLPPWYFELVQVLNVIQESIDKVTEFSRSDILQKPLDNE